MALDMAMRHLKHILMIKILLHKKATKKVDYEELWEEQQLKRENSLNRCKDRKNQTVV